MKGGLREPAQRRTNDSRGIAHTLEPLQGVGTGRPGIERGLRGMLEVERAGKTDTRAPWKRQARVNSIRPS